jgi:AraC-like DNA-binding protein
MTFRLFDTIVATGVLNALVFAGYLYYTNINSLSHRMLSCLLLIMGLLGTKILLHTLDLWQTPYFRYFPLGIDLFLQPLLFLYVLALTEPEKINKTLIKKHLVLPSIFFIYALFIYLNTVFLKDLAQKQAIADVFFYDEIKTMEDFLSVVSGIYYGILAYNQLKKYNQWVETYLSNTSIPTYYWLRNLLVATAVVLLLLGIMITSQQWQVISFIPIQLFYLYLVFLIYVFGFFGFRHQNFKVSLELISKKTEAAANTQVIELLGKFEQWMQKKKTFLEPDLNLNQCAEQLGCTPQSLSEAINSGSYKNFRDYVNQLRIEEFKQRILKTNLQKETIMGTAYECGFNSEPSFYRIFKEKTGTTPKEFLRQQ